jgi:hypothetical protein
MLFPGMFAPSISSSLYNFRSQPLLTLPDTRYIPLNGPGLDRSPDRHAARIPPASPGRAPRNAAACRGSKVSLEGLLQDQLIQRQIRYGLLEPHVLLLEILHASGLGDLHPAILPALAVIALLRDAQIPAELFHTPSWENFTS